MAFNGSEGPINKRLCVGGNSDAPPEVGNNRIIINTGNDGEPRRKRQEAARPNHILLFTIINPVYPITVDVLHTICSNHGQVQRIVIFKKNGVQAMVEFESIDSATRAREQLNGADIYSGCCTLKIDYAKPEKLNVFKNDGDTSWDYTMNVKELGNNGRSPLLQDPLYGSRPQPYNSGGNPAEQFSRSSELKYPNSGGNSTEQFSRGSEKYPKPSLLGPGGNLYQPFGAPDFHQTNDGWNNPGLMKDPPLSTRNGPANFVAQNNPQVGAVMMVYGLDSSTSNTDKLFNLICLYGNVARIKFLKTKEGTAMVQMGDSVAVERCVQHLNNIPFGKEGKLQIAFSKQNFLSEVTNPFNLPDHTPSFREYTGSKNNRFLSPAQASKNRIQPPSKILHFFNTPPGMTDEQLLTALTHKECTPVSIRMFPMKTDRSSSGLIEFANVAEAVNAIMKCNHIPIESKGTKFPFIMKLCFSSSRNMNAAWNNENNGNEMKIHDEQ